jgi:hypothetical protein
MSEEKTAKWSSLHLAIAAWVLPPILWGGLFLVGGLVAFLMKAHITVSGPVVYGILALLFLGLHMGAVVRGLTTLGTAQGKAGIVISVASLLFALVLVPMYFTRIAV